MELNNRELKLMAQALRKYTEDLKSTMDNVQQATGYVNVETINSINRIGVVLEEVEMLHSKTIREWLTGLGLGPVEPEGPVESE